MKYCPKCTGEMKGRNIGDVTVDECQKCKGVWFDEGELPEVKDTADPDLNWMDFEIWKHEDKFKAKESALECPACKTKVQSVNYGDTAVEIDVCSKCKGIWLDKGEFKKIIEALESELLNKSFSKYISATIQEAKEIITGPESMVSEWKDFKTVLRMMKYRMFAENPKLVETLTKIQEQSPFK